MVVQRAFQHWVRRISPAALRRLVAGPLLYALIATGPVFGLAWSFLARACSGSAFTLMEPRAWRLLRNSLGLAAVVSAASGLIGMGLSVWLVSGTGRLRNVARRLYFVPLLIPPYVYALGWTALLSREGPLSRVITAMLGIPLSAYGFLPSALVLSMLLSPIVTLLYLTALDSIDPELIEAAAILEHGRNLWRRIVLPLAIPALLGGMGVVFALSLVEYGVPALFEFNVYSMEIRAEFSQSGDPVAATGLAVPLLLAAVAVVSISQARWTQMPLRSRPGGCPPLRHLAHLTAGHKISVSVFYLVALAPMIALVFRAGSIGVVQHAIVAAQREMGLSLSLALGSALLATGIALPSALSLSRRRFGGRIWSLYALPLAIPAPLYGIGLIYLLNRPLTASIYSSPLVLLLAHVGRFLPHAVFALATQFSRIDPSLHEAARLHPVGRLRTILRVHLPLVAPGLIACAAIVFILSLGELGASLLVVPPGSATISLRLFNLLHYGASASVSGLTIVVIALAGAVGTISLWLVRRRRL